MSSLVDAADVKVVGSADPAPSVPDAVKDSIDSTPDAAAGTSGTIPGTIPGTSGTPGIISGTISGTSGTADVTSAVADTANPPVVAAVDQDVQDLSGLVQQLSHDDGSSSSSSAGAEAKAEVKAEMILYESHVGSKMFTDPSFLM